MTVRKAVIPVAGLSTRMYPAARVMPKALMPIITADGRFVPVIQSIVEEVIRAGVDQIALVVAPDQRHLFERHFSTAGYGAFSEAAQNNPKLQKEFDRLVILGNQITYIEQPKPLGLGHALFCAANWIGSEHSLVMLGDHVYRSYSDKPCIRQLVEQTRHYTNQLTQNFLGVFPHPPVANRCYAMLANQAAQFRQNAVKRLMYTPLSESEIRELTCKGLQPGEFWCVLGAFVASPTILEFLETLSEIAEEEEREINLSQALDFQVSTNRVRSVIIDGESLEVGDPMQYMNRIDLME